MKNKFVDDEFLVEQIFRYAQIDKNGYCVGLSTLSGLVDNPNMILLKEEDVKLGQKYDLENKVWLDEIKKQPEFKDEHHSLTKTINENVETTSFDNLLNMDMLLAIDEKLNTIIEHLGI